MIRLKMPMVTNKNLMDFRSHWVTGWVTGWAIFPGNHWGNHWKPWGQNKCNKTEHEACWRGVPNRFWLNHKLRFAAVGHSSPSHVSSTKGEVVPPLSTLFGDQNDQRLDQLNLSQAVLKENPQKTKNPQANCMSLDTNLVD